MIRDYEYLRVYPTTDGERLQVIPEGLLTLGSAGTPKGYLKGLTDEDFHPSLGGCLPIVFSPLAQKRFASASIHRVVEGALAVYRLGCFGAQGKKFGDKLSVGFLSFGDAPKQGESEESAIALISDAQKDLLGSANQSVLSLESSQRRIKSESCGGQVTRLERSLSSSRENTDLGVLVHSGFEVLELIPRVGFVTINAPYVKDGRTSALYLE